MPAPYALRNDTSSFVRDLPGGVRLSRAEAELPKRFLESMAVLTERLEEIRTMHRAPTPDEAKEVRLLLDTVLETKERLY